MPPDTEEKQKNLGGFFSDPEHAPQTIVSKLPQYVKSVLALNPSIESWALLGVSPANEYSVSDRGRTLTYPVSSTAGEVR